MSCNWIDFKELRSKLHLSELFKFYHIELKIKGDRAIGFCPLPGHPKHEGKRHSPSFSANLARGVFQCFGCRAKGNCLDFVAYMEGVDPSDTQALRRVALMLRDRLGLSSGTIPNAAGNTAEPNKSKPPVPASQPLQLERPRVINAPINFELKTLDAEHPYLASRGLKPETVQHFGLGFCSRGLMTGRIAIPLHDADGNLIGYAGRLADDTKVSPETPKYRFPGERERDGVINEFHKSRFLFNGHRITAPVKDLIVCEGFMSVFWLVQNGYPNVVALMGSDCSREQAELIVNIVAVDGHVWVFPDGDDAGDRCAESLFTEVGKYRFVRWVSLDDGQQPTGCSPLNLSFLLPPHCLKET